MPLEWDGATRVPTPRGDRIADLSRGTALHQHRTSIELVTRNCPQFRDSSTWDPAVRARRFMLDAAIDAAYRPILSSNRFALLELIA